MKVGMISFAHQGHANSYARCLMQTSGVEIAAIADADEARGREAVRRYGGDFYQDYQELLRRDDVSAVVVCSANGEHREMVIAAAEAGKHVLCEKPIATTRADALAMVEACKRAGVIFQIAFPMRFSPPAVDLRRQVRAGAVGTPLSVVATNPGSYPGGWFGDPTLAGGGAVMDHTVHVADMLRWIFEEEIVSVYAEVSTRLHPDLPVDDCGMLMLKLSNGMPVSLDASWSRPKSWPIWGGVTMEVIGDQGVLMLDAFRQNLIHADDRNNRYRFVPWGEGGDPALVSAFVAAARTSTEPPVTGEDGLRALEVALCAYESAQRHEPVACPDGLVG
ncbi:MAG: Gfo/Idh/MocA family protein [Thermomicrobiales bacterium]